MKKTYKLNLCGLLLMAVCLMSISSSGNTSTFTMPANAVTARASFMASTYTINNPVLTVNPTSLNGFTYDYGAGPSAAQTFTVSGSNLSQNVTVYAPTGFQVSTLQGGGYYSSSLTLTPNSGNLTATVHVRMAAGLPVGDHSGSVTVHGGAGLTATVSLSGYVSQYLVVAHPAFSPASGVYNAAQSVTISCATQGATIRYTTNGAEPTTSSQAYSAPLEINQTTTVRAKAWKAGYQPSEVASATYTFNNLSPVLTVNPTSLNGFTYVYEAGPSTAQSFSVSGSNLPTNTGVTVTAPVGFEVSTQQGSGYSVILALPPNSGNLEATTVYVRMAAGLPTGDYSGSVTVSCGTGLTATVSLSGSVSPATVATPTFTPAGGAYNAAQSVTISCATQGATIRYTTDGTAPTENSPAYSAPLNINQTTTVKAKAWKTGYQPSEIASASYTITYTITTTATPGNGGTVSGGGQYSYGQSCTVVATASTGYSFVSWTENGSTVSQNASYTFIVTGNRTLVAHFSQAQYNIIVSASPQEGGTITGGGGYDYGETCTLHAVPNNGYTFLKWTENGTQISTNPTLTFNVTGSRTLVAHFQLQNYTITATANPSSGGNVSGGGQYTYGQTCTLHAVPNSGYTFLKWTKNGSQVSTNPDYSFTVTGSASYVAHFQLQSYTITATANPSNGGTVSGGGQYEHGQSCTLVATASTGYNFVRWTKNGQQVSTNASYTFTVTESASYVAHFQLQSYTITVSANPSNGGTVSGGGEYTYGQNCTLEATPNPGYTFLRWTENGQQVSVNASYTFTVTGNRTLIAQFQAQSYTITATANPVGGGTVAGGGSYTYGQSCTLTATPANGYNFSRWTKNGQQVSTNPNYTFTVTGSAAYVAHFTQQSCAISVSANPTDGGSVSGGGQYNYGQNCTVHAEANTGHTFVNWTENGSQVSANADYTFTVTGSRNLVAHFTHQEFVISAVADPEDGGTVGGSCGYDYGDGCTLTATPATGYDFKNWTKDGQVVGTDPSISFTVTESATYVARFQKQSFTIGVTADPTDGGEISGGDTFEYGELCTLQAHPNEGYTFTHWTEDGTDISSDTVYVFTVEGDRDFVAHFRIQQYIITANAEPAEGGTVEGGGAYDYGAECTLTAEANDHYDFVKWTKDGDSISATPTYVFHVEASATYVAHFQKKSYTINVEINPAEGGRVEGIGTYPYGEQVILEAIPNPGYAFVNWSDENGHQISTNPIWSSTVTGDRTLVAQFTQNVSGFTISVSVNLTDGGTVTGAGNYTSGLTCILTATANDGYQFVNWTENGVIQWLTEQYRFVVDRDRTLVANFEALPTFTILAMSGPNGSITPVGDVKVVKGSNQTFTMTPDTGCRIVTVLADGIDIGPVETYTFTNINRDHTIYVLFSGMGVEEEQILNVNVYPNPAKDIVYVEGEGIETVALYDMLGNCLRSIDYNTSKELNVSGLPKGAYVLKLMTQDGRMGYQKLVLN